MIKLRFSDQDVEHSPEAMDWLRRVENDLNVRLPEDELERMKMEMLVFGSTYFSFELDDSST